MGEKKTWYSPHFIPTIAAQITLTAKQTQWDDVASFVRWALYREGRKIEKQQMSFFSLKDWNDFEDVFALWLWNPANEKLRTGTKNKSNYLTTCWLPALITFVNINSQCQHHKKKMELLFITAPICIQTPAAWKSTYLLSRDVATAENALSLSTWIFLQIRKQRLTFAKLCGLCYCQLGVCLIAGISMAQG